MASLRSDGIYIVVSGLCRSTFFCLAMVDSSLCPLPSYHCLSLYSYKSPYKRLRQIGEAIRKSW